MAAEAMVEKLARWDNEHNSTKVMQRSGGWFSEWSIGSACTGSGSCTGIDFGNSCIIIIMIIYKVKVCEGIF